MFSFGPEMSHAMSQTAIALNNFKWFSLQSYFRGLNSEVYEKFFLHGMRTSQLQNTQPERTRDSSVNVTISEPRGAQF